MTDLVSLARQFRESERRIMARLDTLEIWLVEISKARRYRRDETPPLDEAKVRGFDNPASRLAGRLGPIQDATTGGDVRYLGRLGARARREGR